MNKNFLLGSKTAKKLYKTVKSLPIIDYHNHLSLSDIESNRRFTDIYDLWIAPDPYKHRAMRMCGVSEDYITGKSDKKEKFIKWCEIFPRLIGNPLYHWTIMELSCIFGIEEAPNAVNALSLYERCNDFLQKNNVTPEYFIKKFNAELICPCFTLTENPNILKNKRNVTPSLRGDNILAPSKAFIQKLSEITNIKIETLDDYKTAVSKEIGIFKESGCIFSDHALDNGFKFFEDDGKSDEYFIKILNGDAENDEKTKFFCYMLTFVAGIYAKENITLQLHVGAQRYTSSDLRQKAGAAGGFAAIGSCADIDSLARMLDTIDKYEARLPKTVLFTLNPADNAVFSCLSGSFSKDGKAGLITQGPAWWWCDHKKGIEDMLLDTAVFSLLYNFAGMTTDSRSFLSFVRHDYFRRILCDLLGKKFDSGEISDYNALEDLAKRMCYLNAKECIGGINSEIYR